MGSPYGDQGAVFGDLGPVWRPRSCVATKSCVACFLRKISSETLIGTKRKTFPSRLEGEQNGVTIW